MNSLLEQYCLLSKSDRRRGRLRDQLIAQHQNLAFLVARRYSSVCHEEIEVLKQVALIGLSKAIDRFDPGRRYKLSSFAVPYIRGDIQHYLRDNWSLLKIPRRWLEAKEAVDRVEKQFLAKSRRISRVEIAEAMGIAPEKWRQIDEALHSSVFGFDEGEELNLADESDLALENIAFRQSMLRQIAQLPRRYRECLLMTFFERKSERQVAKKLSITVVEVEALRLEGLALLRSRLLQCHGTSPNVAIEGTPKAAESVDLA